MKHTLLLLLALSLTLAVGACEQRAERMVEQAAGTAEQAADAAEKPAAQAEAPADQGEELVWVFRHRRIKQCYGDDMSLDESRAKLTENGVAVHESHCGLRTDKVFTSGCGEPSGDILLHLIRAKSLNAALEVGYGPAEQIRYQKGKCPDDSAETSSPGTSQ